MKGALVILAFLIVVGIILYLLELRHLHRDVVIIDSKVTDDGETATEEATEIDGGANDSGECCGMHLVCEKTSLSPMSADIEYYDDEELDRFIGRPGNDYSQKEIEEFRDVLLTLRPADVMGWARSITSRHIELPPDVKDELFILVREQRAKSQLTK